MKTITIEIPEFLTHVVLSKKRRAKYKILVGGKKVISNSRSVGKEKKWKINGQALYSGMNYHLRSKVIKEMKKYLYEYIRPIKKIDFYPLSIELIIHDVEGIYNKDKELVSSWDLGNKEFIWMKCFEDALCGNVDFYSVDSTKEIGKKIFLPLRDEYPAKIKDDSVQYITKRICTFKKINKMEDRKLVFIIKQTQDD